MSSPLVRKTMIRMMNAMLLLASPALAQQQVAVQPQRMSETSSATQVKVTVNLNRVPLKRAINTLAEKSGVRIQYQGTLLDAVTKPVSLHANGIPLGDALAQVLAGTSLHAMPIAKDLISIEPVETNVAADGVIAGKVIHKKTRQPIAGVTIALAGSSNSVVTGEDGTFRLTAAPGERTVNVRAVGYVRQTQTVIVPDGSTVSVEIVLEPSASVLDEVVVTGTVVATERKAISTPITVITAEDIEKRGITRVEQLFRGEIPGVMALELGSDVYSPELGKMATAQVYVRGASALNESQSNPLKVYVDGVELLDPSYLGTIDPQSIERMEIISGPQAATIYGSGAMGGVMQIFTKKGVGGAATNLQVSLNYGMLENNLSSGRAASHKHTLTVSGGSGPIFSYSGSLSYLYTGQWQPKLFNRRYGASIGVSHISGPLTASGSLSATSGSNGTSYEYIPPYDAARIAVGDWMIKSGRGLQNAQRLAGTFSQNVALNLEYRVSSNWSHHLTVGRNQTDFEIDPTAAVYYMPEDSLQINAGSTGARMSAGYNTVVLVPQVGVLSQTLTFGANISTGKQVRVNGCTVSATAIAYLTCSAYPGLAVTKDRNDESWGGFGSWRTGLFDQLFFTFGLRGEHNSDYGRDHKIDWTPTTGAAFTVDRGDLTVKLLASYGRATRPPAPDQRLESWTTSPIFSPSQFPVRYAAPELTPEYSRGPQGGIEMYYGGIGSITINRYVQEISDLIQQIHVDSVFLTQLSNGRTQWRPIGQYWNTATIRQHGWEVTSTATIANFSLKGTYSWNDSRVKSLSPRQLYGITFAVGQSFRSVPSHTANVTLGYSRGGTSMSLVTNYIGSRIKSSLDYFLFYEKSNTRFPMYLDRLVTSTTDVYHSGYVKSDIIVSQQVAPWATLILNMVNAANSYGSEIGFRYPALGRQTNIGVTLRPSYRR